MEGMISQCGGSIFHRHYLSLALRPQHMDNGIITAPFDVLRHRFHYGQMFLEKGNVIPLLADL